MPVVSVILPTYNRQRFLEAAIHSVQVQTYPDWELVIADDGSDQSTREYLQGISSNTRNRVLWLEHSGNPAKVRNQAIAIATGDYLAFLDSDDVWSPAKLEKQLAALRNRAGSRWSYTGIDQIDANSQPIAGKHGKHIIRPEGWIFEKLLRLEIGIAMPTVVAERQLVIEAGGFDEQQRFGEFHDFCLRLALRARVAVVHEPLCSVRTHSDHYSSDRVSDHAGWMRLYKKMTHLTDNPALRAHCARMRAATAVKLARQQGFEGNSLGAWATLLETASFSWRYPNWWRGALKELLRPIIPRAVKARRVAIRVGD